LSIKKQIIQDYLQKFSDLPRAKLARIIWKDNVESFQSPEHVRDMIQYYEGKKGIVQLCKLSDKKNVRKESLNHNPYQLPKSYEQEREPFILPKGCNNILLISDLHIPYHNIEAITCALKYGQDNNINTIFINGDLMDQHQVSKFEPDPRKRSIKEEFDITKEFLRKLREAFPNASIYWLKGNHCIRWERFMLRKVREIWDDDYFTLEQRLRLNEENINIIDDKILVKAGKLSISHGHHIFKGIFSPVNPSRGAFLKAKQSIIVGHLHRASQHTETDLDGKVITCWSTGCLCELRADYNPIVNNSMHGFAHIIVNDDGDYMVKNYQIINGKLH
jgi:predicted phosphodiesterase